MAFKDVPPSSPASAHADPPAVVAPPPGNPRFPLFDGLRAVAALSVLLYHAGYYSRANEGEAGLSPYLARLNVGVAVFFVISGFLLYRPLLAGAGWRAYADSLPGIPSWTFASTFGWFALGMALAMASVALAHRPHRVLERVARYAWAGWIIAIAAYATICRGLGLGGGFVFFQRETTVQDLAVYALSGVLAAGLVLPAAFERSPRAIRRVLGAPVIAWLGLVSYGIYLYHQPIAN